MKINLHDIVPIAMESDIIKAGGDKIHESYYQIQYFDFIKNGIRKFTIPQNIPEKFSTLFEKLTFFSKSNKSLKKQNLYLFMKEAYGECALVLYSNSKSDMKPSILFRLEFIKVNWTIIEDILLSAGLAVFRRNEVKTLRYFLKKHSADYELVIIGDNATLTLNAPDDMRFIKSLMVIGQSFIEKPKFQAPIFCQ